MHVVDYNKELLMEKSLDYDYIFKYILIGDASVGKSTLLNMFINQTFICESNPTMGVEFATKKMMINDKIIKVQIWDTAGQQSFRTITRAYYKNAIGVILVYDLNNAESLKTIDLWLGQIRDNSRQIAQIILVGNKSDLCPGPSVPPKEGLPYIATSAKTGHNIKKLFNNLTQTILGNIANGKINVQAQVSGIKKGNIDPSQRLKLTNQIKEEKGERKSCCV